MTTVSRVWTWLPVIVRAVVVGMVIQVVGVFSFGLLAQLNLAFVPTLPWSAPLELLLLWLMYLYLRGDGPPRSTANLRRRRLRAYPVVRRLIPSTVFTGVSLGFAVFFQMVFAYRLVAMPETAGGALLAFVSAPPLTAICILLAGVLMTGFVEEAAFRGYMQQPVEERHGPTIAIVLVAVLFAAVHAPPLVIFPLFAFGALGWGLYVRLASSTVPAMVVHAAVDAVAFAWVFAHPEGLSALLSTSVLENGMDPGSWIAAIGAVITTTTTIIGFLWMARTRCTIEQRDDPPDDTR